MTRSEEQRRNIRRTALIMAGIAVAFYVGFILMASYTAFAAWASIMLGWLIKVLVLRYGGNRLYIALKPVAISLLVGEAAMILLFAAIRAVATLMGHKLEPIHLIPL